MPFDIEMCPKCLCVALADCEYHRPDRLPDRRPDHRPDQAASSPAAGRRQPALQWVRSGPGLSDWRVSILSVPAVARVYLDPAKSRWYDYTIHMSRSYLFGSRFASAEEAQIAVEDLIAYTTAIVLGSAPPAP